MTCLLLWNIFLSVQWMLCWIPQTFVLWTKKSLDILRFRTTRGSVNDDSFHFWMNCPFKIKRNKLSQVCPHVWLAASFLSYLQHLLGTSMLKYHRSNPDRWCSSKTISKTLMRTYHHQRPADYSTLSSSLSLSLSLSLTLTHQTSAWSCDHVCCSHCFLLLPPSCSKPDLSLWCVGAASVAGSVTGRVPDITEPLK